MSRDLKRSWNKWFLEELGHGICEKICGNVFNETCKTMEKVSLKQFYRTELGNIWKETLGRNSGRNVKGSEESIFEVIPIVTFPSSFQIQ